jgi:hypothetical protein
MIRLLPEALSLPMISRDLLLAISNFNQLTLKEVRAIQQFKDYDAVETLLEQDFAHEWTSPETEEEFSPLVE